MIKTTGIEPLELDDLYCAAYLHDTLEDTDLSADEILDKFGSTVLGLVKELTSDPSQMATFPSKGDYLLHKMQHMSPHALFIKLLDRLDNISDYRDDSNALEAKGSSDSKSVRESAKKYAMQTLLIMDGLKGRERSYLPIINVIYQVCKDILDICHPGLTVGTDRSLLI